MNGLNFSSLAATAVLKIISLRKCLVDIIWYIANCSIAFNIPDNK